ncbi:hypothetical protein AAMO2058_000280000 [Amorphochlora amoebiformis]
MDYSYKTIQVTFPHDFVASVELARPKALNAMNQVFVKECGIVFQRLRYDPRVRVIVLSGQGKHFSAGLDLSDSPLQNEEGDVGRKAIKFRKLIHDFQSSFTAIEKCLKPVLCAIHGATIGGAIDMITAADIRFCTKDAFFSVKEVDIGIAADVGTLQRLPKVIGSESLVRELCFTARKMYADEAKSCGLVSHVFQDRKTMMKAAFSMGVLIASKSPIAVQGTKAGLVHARDHSVQEGLEFMKHWNMSMLQSEDIPKSVQSFFTKKKPKFSKL